jgi:hypothetical protein
MRPARGRDRRIGALALAAAALLGGSPAAAPPRPAAPVSPPPGPACHAGEPDPVDVAAIEAFVESLRRHAARRAAGREPVVSLDGGGYAYGRPPHPFTQIPGRDE